MAFLHNCEINPRARVSVLAEGWLLQNDGPCRCQPSLTYRTAYYYGASSSALSYTWARIHLQYWIDYHSDLMSLVIPLYSALSLLNPRCHSMSPWSIRSQSKRSYIAHLQWPCVPPHACLLQVSQNAAWTSSNGSLELVCAGPPPVSSSAKPCLQQSRRKPAENLPNRIHLSTSPILTLC